MSRAFVKDQDELQEEFPDRAISPNPNFVTLEGLHQIDHMVETLRKEQAEAQRSGDKAALGRSSRDLRYWVQRRTSAQLVPPPKKANVVAFATRVTIEREGGRRQTFAIVGEDEADPSKGKLAYSSPVARSLLGRKLGEFAETPGGEVEIVSLEAVGAES